MKSFGDTHDHLEWCCASEAYLGQVESGDRCLVKKTAQGILIGVIDGIGHGKEAAEAAQTALEIINLDPKDSVIALVQRVHEGLRATRGVVMTLSLVNPEYDTVTWLGVGNVQGSLLHPEGGGKSGYESVLLRGGVVGHQLPPLKAEVIPIRRDDLLVFATDGVYSGCTMGIDLSGTPRQISDRVLKVYSKGNDDALVLVARYLGGTDGKEAS